MNITHVKHEDLLVELLRRYANRADLLFDLNQALDRVQGSQHVVADEEQPHELSSACQDPRRRLLSARFTYEDVASMIAKFDTGTPAKIIAEEHQIGLTSLKRLIRERGRRRKDQRTGAA
jgi:hypothetical protein